MVTKKKKKKRKSGKITGTVAARVWELALAGESYVDIAKEVGYTTSRIKIYVPNKFKKEADKLWAEEVKRLYGYKCAAPNCRGENLQAHHMIEKGKRPHLRYEAMNGVCLCKFHHMFDPFLSGHSGTSAAKSLWDHIEERWYDQYLWLEEHKDDKTYQQVDYEAEFWRLARENNG